MSKPVEYVGGGDSGVVLLHYQDLVDGADLSDSIDKAYGFDGLGLLAVEGVPEMAEKRQTLLPLAYKYAMLPDDIKQKSVHEASHYSFGWSHGKEQLEGKPDYSKGSYYANPQYDNPVNDDKELIQKYPEFVHPNIWPEDLPGMEKAFKEMGQLIVHVGVMIAQQCDKHVQKKLGKYEEGKLTRIITKSRVCKARLLHYFATEGAEGNKTVSESSWCGWHNDHGSLTGLCPGMFMKNGDEIKNPDPEAGLYIRSRHGDLVKAAVPTNMMAFQIGETAQVHSGGILQATPHCVRAAKGPGSDGVSRESFAVFMEPEWDEAMTVPEGVDPTEAQKAGSAQYLPEGVPVLEARWQPTMDFGGFTKETLKCYYEGGKK
eukprot:GFYU01005757.1.p1 GENE.GFYU01005757.1~~GFYU01005757.1.p1  ORF type:complete len:374 (+),score=149.88 GFYU01005757.1:63-1184(+)